MATSDQFQIDENKELLLSRVNQLVFVDGVAGFECGRCDRVLVRHYRANCGHYFCANCKRVITVSKSNCPLGHCEKPIEDLDFQDIEFERKLYDLRAHCPNKDYGCPYVSQLKDLGDHLRVCRDTRDNALPVLIEDNRVEEILRELSDKFDNLSSEVSKIKKETCKIDKSLTDLETKVDNKMKNMETKMEEMSTNLEQKLKLKSFVQLGNPQMTILSLVENKGNFQPNLSWRITGIREKVKQKTFEIESEVFEWIGYPIRAQAKLELKSDDKVYVSQSLEENELEKLKDVKLTPQVFYVLRDQTNKSSPKHRCRAMGYLCNSNSSLEYDLPIGQKSLLNNSTYNVDDTLIFEIYLEPPTIAQSVHSLDGTLNWAIDNYQKRKEMAIEGVALSCESPYFYTGPRGYRVQVKIRLTGLKTHLGKGLIAVVGFLPGEFDVDLPKTFLHKTTITLFNRRDPRCNIVKTVVKDIETSYIIKLCDKEEVENVITNDVIFYKVSIEPSN